MAFRGITVKLSSSSGVNRFSSRSSPMPSPPSPSFCSFWLWALCGLLVMVFILASGFSCCMKVKMVLRSLSFFLILRTSVSKKFKMANSTRAANTVTKHMMINTSNAVGYPTWKMYIFFRERLILLSVPHAFVHDDDNERSKLIIRVLGKKKKKYTIFFVLPEVYFFLQNQLLLQKEQLWHLNWFEQEFQYLCLFS